VYPPQTAQKSNHITQLLQTHDLVRREQQSDQEEESDEDVPLVQQAQPEALMILDMIHVNDGADHGEDPGFFPDSSEFWARFWSFIPVSLLKSPLLLYLFDNSSS